MSTVEVVKNTKAFQREANDMIISASMIGMFDNAISCKNVGYTYDQWLADTTAGSLAKAIVKEIFETTQPA